MNDKDISKILKDPDSKITLEEALQMVSILKKSIIEYDEALEKKIIGSHSFYEGEYHAFHITESILNKLTFDGNGE